MPGCRPEQDAPHVVGVDARVVRRGRTYRAIVVDLEHQCVADGRKMHTLRNGRRVGRSVPLLWNYTCMNSARQQGAL